MVSLALVTLGETGLVWMASCISAAAFVSTVTVTNFFWTI